jgi:hypothetical protein
MPTQHADLTVSSFVGRYLKLGRLKTRGPGSCPPPPEKLEKLRFGMAFPALSGTKLKKCCKKLLHNWFWSVG